MTGEDGVEGPGGKSMEKAKKASHLREDSSLVTDRKPPERGFLIGY